MVIQIDEQIRFEVKFDLLDREEGYDDDIRFIISETIPGPERVFAADETSLLLTPDQAELLARARLVAASRRIPR